jgi:hypothetical protein
MMRGKTFILTTVLALTALLWSSCASRIPFTQEVRQQYTLTDQELRSIQFWTSDDIILHRDVTDASEVGTDRGTLKVKSGRTIEEVVIRRGTPCVVQSVMDNKRLVLSFGEGPNELLVFGDVSDKGVRFRRGHYYAMLAADFRNGRDVVEFDGKEFIVADPGHPVFLLFKMTSIRELERSTKTVKGKKL